MIKKGSESPLGTVSEIEYLDKGLVRFEAANGRGFHLDRRHNDKVPPMIRSSDGFYNEGIDAAKVVLSFPKLFSRTEVHDAEKVAKKVFPEAYLSAFSELA